MDAVASTDTRADYPWYCLYSTTVFGTRNSTSAVGIAFTVLSFTESWLPIPPRRARPSKTPLQERQGASATGQRCVSFSTRHRERRAR
jgi:hypothetical protein